MRTTYHYIIAIMLSLTSLGALAQNSYLLNFEHKEGRDIESMYFYLEELPAGSVSKRVDVVHVEDSFYRIYFLRLSEPNASSYMGCSKYANQASGELLSLGHLLSDSVLYGFEQKQKSIEAECTALLNNRGRQNTLLALNLNSQDRIKMIGIKFDLCNCKVSSQKFSPLSDTLAMVRKIQDVNLFSDSEKSYWKNNIGIVLDNTFVKSCLPSSDRFEKAYQASRE